MATVLVIGGSRGIGLAAVRQALEAGHTVRALARSADGIPIDHARFAAITGSALDADAVANALDGVDVVIQALGVALNRRTVLGPVRLFSQATAILLPAMEAAGARRLLSVTGIGTGDSRRAVGCLGRVPFEIVLRRAYDDKTRQEGLIQASDLDWVIARPTVLTRGSRTGRYHVLTEPRRWRNGLISRADVADFLTRQIAGRGFLHTTPVLTY